MENELPTKSIKPIMGIILIMTAVITGAAAGYIIFSKKLASTDLPSKSLLINNSVSTTGVTNKSYVVHSTESMQDISLDKYPDEPLKTFPISAISVKFLFEHRTALNGKAVNVRGIITNTMLGDAACPPDRGACAQQRIFLADTTEENRNKNYDVAVLISDEQQNYSIGQAVELKATVSGNKFSIQLTKI